MYFYQMYKNDTMKSILISIVDLPNSGLYNTSKVITMS